jgi:hypothetical protein
MRSSGRPIATVPDGRFFARRPTLGAPHGGRLHTALSATPDTGRLGTPARPVRASRPGRIVGQRPRLGRIMGRLPYLLVYSATYVRVSRIVRSSVTPIEKVTRRPNRDS